MSAPTAEIWIRHRGTRRQAFYRVGTTGWHDLPMPVADKAVRTGRLTYAGLVDAPCVPRETQAHLTPPGASDFASKARALNSAIDSILNPARGAA